MTTFKDELEKILDLYSDWAYFCYNPNEFIDKYDEPPIEYPQIMAIQAIIELVDREIIETDEEVPEWGKLRIDCRNTLRAEQRQKLGVKNNETNK